MSEEDYGVARAGKIVLRCARRKGDILRTKFQLCANFFIDARDDKI